MATVQQDTITHEQVSTLFWVNVGMSVLLMLMVAALSPWIATFYQEPKLQPITLALASLFLFDGLSVQHQALLRRQMQFSVLAKIQILSHVVGIVVAVIAALLDLGYWALIAQTAAAQLLTLCFTWGFTRWMPGRPSRGAGTRNMLKFGGYLTGFNFVNYFARNADKIMIGNAWGSNSLGLYTKAYGLLLMPLHQINGPITAVAIPALSRLQNDPKQFRAFFIKILSIICFATFPFIAWMIVCREEIILIFLGDQWEDAIPIFAVLAFSAFFQPIGNITGSLYIALGRTKRMFKWGLMGCSWIVASFLVGLPYGALGVAVAYSAAIAIISFPLIWYAIQGTSIKFIDFYKAMRNPTLSTVAAVTCGILMKTSNLHQSSWLNLVITSITMVMIYGIVTYKIDRNTASLLCSAIKTGRKPI
jgi:PST family polysaccharide transporter